MILNENFIPYITKMDITCASPPTLCNICKDKDNCMEHDRRVGRKINLIKNWKYKNINKLKKLKRVVDD